MGPFSQQPARHQAKTKAPIWPDLRRGHSGSPRRGGTRVAHPKAVILGMPSELLPARRAPTEPSLSGAESRLPPHPGTAPSALIPAAPGLEAMRKDGCGCAKQGARKKKKTKHLGPHLLPLTLKKNLRFGAPPAPPYPYRAAHRPGCAGAAVPMASYRGPAAAAAVGGLRRRQTTTPPPRCLQFLPRQLSAAFTAGAEPARRRLPGTGGPGAGGGRAAPPVLGAAPRGGTKGETPGGRGGAGTPTAVPLTCLERHHPH